MSLSSVPMEDSTFLEEVEALKAIYIREMNVSYCPSTKQPLCISINLHPATADNEDEQYVCLTLVIKLPLTYPNELPEISIKNPRGLSDEDLDRLTSDLLAKAKDSQGNAMLFELIEMAKEHLTRDNTPRCLCAICLYEFSEEDVFIKTECYHHFHSHCLARYVQSLAASPQDETPPPSHLSQNQPPKVLCPVCREPIRGHLDVNAPPPVRSESAAEFRVDDELKRRQEMMAATFEKQKSRGGIIDIEAEKNKYLIEISTTVTTAVEVSEASHVEPTKANRSGSNSKQHQQQHQQNRQPRNHGSRNANSSREGSSSNHRSNANRQQHHHHHQSTDDSAANHNQSRQQDARRSTTETSGLASSHNNHDDAIHDRASSDREVQRRGSNRSRRGQRGNGTRRGSNHQNGDHYQTQPSRSSLNATAESASETPPPTTTLNDLETLEEREPRPERTAVGNYPRGRGGRNNGNRRTYGESRGGGGNRGHESSPTDVDARDNRKYDETADGETGNARYEGDRRAAASGRGYQRSRRPRRSTFQDGRGAGHSGGSTDQSIGPNDSVGEDSNHAEINRRGGSSGRVNNRRYWSSSSSSSARNASHSDGAGATGAHHQPDASNSTVTSTDHDGRYRGNGGGRNSRNQRHPRSGRGWDSRRGGGGSGGSGGPPSTVPLSSPSREQTPTHRYSESSATEEAPVGAEPGVAQASSRRIILTGPPNKSSFGTSHASVNASSIAAATTSGVAAANAATSNRNHREPRRHTGDPNRPTPPPPPGFKMPLVSTGELQSLVSAAKCLSVVGQLPPPGFESDGRHAAVLMPSHPATSV